MHERSAVRKYADLIRETSNKWPNCEPSKRIEVGEYGRLTKDGIWEREGNIFEGDAFKEIVQNTTPTQHPTEDKIVIQTLYARQISFNVGVESNIPPGLVEGGFNASWKFSKHTGAVLVALRPRLTSLNSKIKPAELFKHRSLQGYSIVTEVTTCMCYAMALGNKGDSAVSLSFSASAPLAGLPLDAGGQFGTGWEASGGVRMHRTGGGDVPDRWTVMYFLKDIKPWWQRTPWRGDGPDDMTIASLDRLPTTVVPWGMLDSDGESDDDDEFESMSLEGSFTDE